MKWARKMLWSNKKSRWGQFVKKVKLAALWARRILENGKSLRSVKKKGIQ